MKLPLTAMKGDAHESFANPSLTMTRRIQCRMLTRRNMPPMTGRRGRRYPKSIRGTSLRASQAPPATARQSASAVPGTGWGDTPEGPGRRASPRAAEGNSGGPVTPQSCPGS